MDVMIGDLVELKGCDTEFEVCRVATDGDDSLLLRPGGRAGRDEPKGPHVPIPRYRSHKVVRAFKIAKIEPSSQGQILMGTEGEMVTKNQGWYLKHSDQKCTELTGGYYVEYEDGGYASWSPPKEFEAGYTRIE